MISIIQILIIITAIKIMNKLMKNKEKDVEIVLKNIQKIQSIICKN